MQSLPVHSAKVLMVLEVLVDVSAMPFRSVARLLLVVDEACGLALSGWRSEHVCLHFSSSSREKQKEDDLLPKHCLPVTGPHIQEDLEPWESQGSLGKGKAETKQAEQDRRTFGNNGWEEVTSKTCYSGRGQEMQTDNKIWGFSRTESLGRTDGNQCKEKEYSN